MIALSAFSALAQSNDNFANRQVLSGGRVATTGDTSAATLEPGEPVNATSEGRTVWYTWTAPATGWVTIDTKAASNSTTIIWTGTALANLARVITVTNRGSNVLAFWIPGTAARFAVQSGLTYQICVASTLGGPFALFLDLSTMRISTPTNNALISATPALELAITPPDPGIEGDIGYTTFKIDPGNSTSVVQFIEISWRPYPPPPARWPVMTSTPGALMAVVSNLPPDSYVISASATNQAGREIFVPPSLFKVRPANDDFAAATLITNLPYYTSILFTNTSSEAGELVLSNQVGNASLWWQWTAPRNGEAIIFSPAAIGAFTGDSLGTLTLVASGQQKLRFPVAGGVTYHFKAALNTNHVFYPYQPANFEVHLVELNDSFANRRILAGGSAADTGDCTAATIEPGEPDSPFNYRQTLWWTWTAPANGLAHLRSTRLTYVAASVWQGSELTNLTLVGSEFFDIYTWPGVGQPYLSYDILRFPVTQGETYQIRLSSHEWSAQFLGFSLDVCTFSITAPTNYAVYTGPRDLSVQLSGPPRPDIEGPLTGFVVRFAGQPLSFFDDGPEYRVEPSGHPMTALFTNLPPNDYTLVAEATNAAGHYISTPSIQMRIAPDNDNFASARLVSDFGSQEFTLAGASEELGEPLFQDQVGGQSIWFRWTAPIDQIVVAAAPGHALGAFTGPDLNELTLTGTSSAGVVRLEARAGMTYHFKVALSYLNRLGRFSLSSSLANDDFANRIAISGSDFTLLVTNAAASIEPNEPVHATSEFSFTYPGSLWWSWIAPSAGLLIVYDAETEFGNYGRIIDSYTGDALSGLTPHQRFTNSLFGGSYTIRVTAGETIHFALSATFAETNLLYRFRLLPDPPSNSLRAELIAPYHVIVSFQGEPGATYALENSFDFVSWSEAFQFYAEDTPTYMGPSSFCCSEFFRVRRVETLPPALP